MSNFFLLPFLIIVIVTYLIYIVIIRRTGSKDKDYQRRANISQIYSTIVAMLALIFIIIQMIFPAEFDCPKCIVDCSNREEIGRWNNPTVIHIKATNGGWVHADFWSSPSNLTGHADEVAVLFKPGDEYEIQNIAGVAWEYDKNWSRDIIEYCIEKHIIESLDRKRIVELISVQQLCDLAQCR